MKVYGSGRAHGGISLLHALGCGNGCSTPIELWTHVGLVEGTSTPEDDDHNLLDMLLEGWKERNLPLPAGETGWLVQSDIPRGMGLKSSSALLMAAVNALSTANSVILSDTVTFNLISAIQTKAGCSITGGRDDIAVANFPSTWIVDANESGTGLLQQLEFPEKEVIIVLRDKQKGDVDIQSFENLRPRFEQIVLELRNGSPIEAFRMNGQAVAEALKDQEALQICEDIEIHSDCPAAISGSGPAIVVLCEPEEAESVKEYLKSKELEFIHTRTHHGVELHWERDEWE
ncbi:MAG: hypothetical protein VYB30_05870 [Candidatus Thermoplasmatota archaeon]|nr:hypothetical protein [Candidatus Thermoplasmatota archaeon]